MLAIAVGLTANMPSVVAPAVGNCVGAGTTIVIEADVGTIGVRSMHALHICRHVLGLAGALPFA